MHAISRAVAGLIVLGVVAATPACAQAASDWAGCLKALRQELPQFPAVPTERFDAETRAAQDLRPVIEQATAAQPEFKLPIWDYLARLVDDERVRDGQAILQREAEPLAAIARRLGVDAATAVAVFGVETDYGRVSGRYPVVDATLSRACLNLGSRERRAHFFAALQLLQEGQVQPEAFRGSWAGAFGLTQFMPGTFLQHREDGDGSGAVDIVGSVPDALATTARFLKSLGWASGVPWGVEVRVARDLVPRWNALERDHGCLGSATPGGRCRRLADWQADGVRRVDGGPLLPLPPTANGAPLQADTVAALLMPAGADGPAWLVTRNYQAIWQYNRADAYGLAIGLLADRLRGDPVRVAAWPTDDPGLSRAELVEVQGLLRRRGHCEVVADGRDGPRTRRAVEAESRALGLAESGRAGQRLLAALRAATVVGVTSAPAVCAVAAQPPAAAASALN